MIWNGIKGEVIFGNCSYFGNDSGLMGYVIVVIWFEGCRWLWFILWMCDWGFILCCVL